MAQKLIFTNLVVEAIDQLVDSLGAPSVFVLVDTNTDTYVLPLLKSQSQAVKNAQIITIPAGDEHKSIESMQTIWNGLSQNGATRSSVVINVGGGMVTDIGGFAASTFKRGVRFINLPTTLLGAVDAAVGGKTGINFNGLKNEIGVFSEAEAVIISTIFFNTLPQQQVLSGYAEMLKHGLLDDKDTLAALLRYNITNPPATTNVLLGLIEKSVSVKKEIVENDPTEKGLRKSLNLGHTIGHAFESYAMNVRKSPIPHGYAVAWGLVVELVLSHMKLNFPADTLHQMAQYIKDNYGYFYITCDDYPTLIDIMSHDKKNATPDQINFTLLSDVGQVHIDQTATTDEIKAALDIYRDLLE